MKSLILIFIALGCGLVASIGISQVMDRGGNAGPALEVEQILVALVDIDAGAKLDATNIKLEDWPRNKVPESAIRTIDEAKDKFAVPRFFKGEPIIATRISDSQGGVSLQIPEGYRAEPVKVEEDTVMRAISPGDRVDVSVFLKRDNKEIPKTGVFPIIRNVRIFAVNSSTERAADAKGGESAFRTVSLLVKEKQVGELQMAAEMGKIRLSLRRPNEGDDEAGEEVTKMADLLAGKGDLGSDPAPAPPPAATPAPGGLNSFLSSGPTLGPSAPTSEWMMDVLTPNGVEQYNWPKRNALPTKSSTVTADASGSSIAPPSAAPSTTETTTPEPTTPGPTIPGDGKSSDSTKPISGDESSPSLE